MSNKKENFSFRAPSTGRRMMANSNDKLNGKTKDVIEDAEEINDEIISTLKEFIKLLKQ